MQFTTVRSKEKDYDIYLKSEKIIFFLALNSCELYYLDMYLMSEKLVHSNYANETNVSQLF